MTMLDPLEVDFQCYILFCFVIIAFLREYAYMGRDALLPVDCM